MKVNPTAHQLVYVHLGGGYAKEMRGPHWCYVVKNNGQKLTVIPLTSIKEDSGPAKEPFDGRRESGGHFLRAPARGGCALWREDAGLPHSFLRMWKSPASLFTGRSDYGNDFSAAWAYASAAARSASVMTLEA